MNRYFKRLLIAFLVSAGCYTFTYLWYQSVSGGSLTSNNQSPVAKLSMAVNDVQRKPLARVIWEEITQNEELYAGEAIRTSAASEAKILFLENGTEIELEPDSLIVLEKTDDGIALDFLQGNLLVKSKKGAEGTGSIKLKSGDNEIKLNDADLSLSKTEEGQVDLEVFSGTAELQQDGKSTTLDKSKAGTLDEKGLKVDENRLQVLSPTPGTPVYIDPVKREKVPFAWEKIPEGYTVFVERGKDRGKLYRNQRITSPGETGKLGVPTKVGKFFFRLVAVPSDTAKPELRSKTFPVDILAKSPPVILQPEKDEQIVVKRKQNKLNLKWVSKNPFEDMVVEISKDPGLRQKVLTEPLNPKLTFGEVEFSQQGQFYMRITGYMNINGKLEPLSSPVIPFTVKQGVELIPPVLKSPAPNQRLTFQQISEQGLFMSWENVPGIKNYKLRIQNSKKEMIVDRVVNTNPLRLNDFPPGTYRWSVASVGPENKLSKYAQLRNFEVEEMPRILWVGGPDESRHFYWTKTPSLIAQWQKNVEGVKSWKVRYVPEGTAPTDNQWRPASAPMIKTNVERDGRYDVEVEGLNEEGKVIARSSKKSFVVAAQALLPAPLFAEFHPDTFKADRRGNLAVEWTSVNGAKSYKLEVLSPEGDKVIKEKVVDRTTASLSKLPPGNYKITVKAIDEYDRDGNSAEARGLDVPKKSAIRAPKIKKLKVK